MRGLRGSFLGILFVVVCVLFVSVNAASAAQFNTASIRGLVSANYPDCNFCWAPGCLLEVGTNGSTGGDPFIIALGNSPDCSGIQAGDCIQATGEVVQGLLSGGLAESTYQMSVSSWSVVSSALCQP